MFTFSSFILSFCFGVVMGLQENLPTWARIFIAAIGGGLLGLVGGVLDQWMLLK